MSAPWGLCPRCGFKKHLNTFRREWTGLRVCPECWDAKHPQLSVKGRVDKQAVPHPAPEPADVFVGVDGLFDSDGILISDNYGNPLFGDMV